MARIIQEMIEMNQKKRSKLFLVDGSALVYRSYFAFIKNPLINSKGENTSAPYGVTRAIIKILDTEKPDYFAVVFDTPEPTFRHKTFASYKANRPKMPDEMVDQLPRIRQIIEAFKIPILEFPGYEADDVIGTLAKRAEKEALDVYMVTSDKDFMQLVSSNIKVYNPKKAEEAAEILDEDGVRGKMGIGPENIVDLLGLMGDSVDNVPGVPGVGIKTALQLVQSFGSIESILENSDKISKQSTRKNIEENKELALLSKDLVIIKIDVPMDISFEQLKFREPDNAKLVELFKELEYNSLISRFMTRDMQIKSDYRTLYTLNDVKKLVEKLKKTKNFTFDLETTHINPLLAQIVGLAFCWKAGEAYYIPVHHEDDPPETDALFKPNNAETLNVGELLNILKPILENPSVKKSGQNIKYDMLVLTNYAVLVQGIDFDTMVAAYLLNPNSRQHNLDSLSLEYLNFKKIPTSELIGKGKNQISMAEVPIEKVAEYACEDADMTQRLREILEPKLFESQLKKLFDTVELPLISVLMDMEKTGICLDQNFLSRMSEKLDKDLAQLIDKIHQIAAYPININSPKQLSELLFDKLKLPVIKKTKTGYSTDVGVLEILAKQHELPKLILEFRQLSKLKSTYVDALPKLINPNTHRIHTSYNQTVAATGRLSSSDPNLQNIPIRTKLGREIRKAFIPQSNDYVLLDADYSQIELRIMAHLSEDPTLIESFKNNEDIHQRTAASMFNVPPDQVTEEQRRQAKAINFGIIYGMGEFGLAQRLDISNEEAAKFINDYFNRYPKVKDFIDSTIDEARENGYVKTLLNRRRNLPDILSDNRRVREFAERIAINTPIQGTAADLIKVAMIHIYQKLTKKKMATKMLLQVHDELVFEVPKNELESAKKLVREEMEGAIKLKVPVRVDIGIGKNWLEAH